MSKSKKPIRGPEDIRIRARELRKQSTPAEKILWEELRDRRLKGIKFRRQHIIGSYIIDFYCPAHRLAIELDGGFHSFQEDNDLIRTNNLEDMGIKVVRFWNHEVEQNLVTVLAKIAKACILPSPTCGRRACPARSAGAGDEGDF
jgi:very-short-patch-repair endonuclease